MPIPHISVSSSVVRSVGYDPKSLTLELTFHSGVTYVYAKVPQTLVTQMMDAKKTRSFGAFVQRHVLHRFLGKRLAIPSVSGESEVESKE